MTSTAEFRHKIGDCLYDLWHEYDGDREEVWMYPIVKRTERYVYVDPDAHRFSEGRLARFSVAELESKGSAWNGPNRMLLYTRPQPHWPLLVVSIAGPRQLTS